MHQNYNKVLTHLLGKHLLQVLDNLGLLPHCLLEVLDLVVLSEPVAPLLLALLPGFPGPICHGLLSVLPRHLHLLPLLELRGPGPLPSSPLPSSSSAQLVPDSKTERIIISSPGKPYLGWLQTAEKLSSVRWRNFRVWSSENFITR